MAGTLALSWLAVAMCPQPWVANLPTLALVHSVLREVALGKLNGEFHGQPNHVDFTHLQPGDIIVCHNGGGGYGYWTHAVLYVGHGHTVDSNDFVRGTELKSVNEYHNYDKVIVLRVSASVRTRKQAADDALEAVGKPYDPFASLMDFHSTYCSKLIWQVYRREGILLQKTKQWVLPDDLVRSNRVQSISERVQENHTDT